MRIQQSPDPNRPNDPLEDFRANGAGPAIRIGHEGTGNALEVVSPSGTVLYSISPAGVPSAGGGGGGGGTRWLSSTSRTPRTTVTAPTV
jgi:hypothetical protein